MIKRLLTTVLVLLPLSISAQQINYAYDANGNRTARTIVLQARAAKGMVQAADSAFLYEHLAQQQLRIYPNPVRKELTIALDSYTPEMQGQLSLYAPNGALLVKCDLMSDITKVNMASFAKGIYVLHIRLGGKNTSWKVIKE